MTCRLSWICENLSRQNQSVSRKIKGHSVPFCSLGGRSGEAPAEPLIGPAFTVDCGLPYRSVASQLIIGQTTEGIPGDFPHFDQVPLKQPHVCDLRLNPNFDLLDRGVTGFSKRSGHWLCMAVLVNRS